MSVKAFLLEFNQISADYNVSEDEDQYWFVLNDYVELDFIDDSDENANSIILNHFTVAADHYDEGWGTEALQTVTALADKHNVTIRATAISTRKNLLDEPIFSDQDLKEWYIKRGFTDDGQVYQGNPEPYHLVKYIPKQLPR